MIPRRHISVLERAHLRAIMHAKDAEERGKLRKRNDLVVSDWVTDPTYTAFQDFAGISSLEHWVRRRGRRRPVPLHLRRFLLVYTLRRH